ncbi:hypothetical protein ACFL0M_16180, partial [Thermodesulfobacteriota bacterium]
MPEIYVSPYSNPQVSRSKQILSISLLLLLAVAVRFHHLDHESLWMDEILQSSYYPHAFARIVTDAASQRQPPLDYWIGHLVYFISDSDFAVRTPAALFGVGAVVLLTIIIAKMCTWWVGIGTGFVAAILPFNIYYSQEARPYSIASFFFLGVLWSLDKLINSTDRLILRGALFLFFTAGFLYSRALAPLVITVAMFLSLLVWLTSEILKHGFTFAGNQRKIISAGLLSVLAIALYFPCFKNILAQGSRDLSHTSNGLGLDILKAGFERFSLMPLWKAYVVQTEPLTHVIVVLLFIFALMAWPSGLWRNNPMLKICTALFVGGSILNIFIFRAKSPLPFRPPYAIYLLPLILILSSAGFE